MAEIVNLTAHYEPGMHTVGIFHDNFNELFNTGLGHAFALEMDKIFTSHDLAPSRVIAALQDAVDSRHAPAKPRVTDTPVNNRDPRRYVDDEEIINAPTIGDKWTGENAPPIEGEPAVEDNDAAKIVGPEFKPQGSPNEGNKVEQL